MAQDLEKLVVMLSADIRKYENSLNRAAGVTNKQMRVVESRFAAANKRISGGISGLAGTAAKAFAVIGGVAGGKELLDAGTRITNSLKVAGLSGEKLVAVYDSLLASAQKNAAPLETLVGLYSRAAQAQTELGVSTQELTAFADNVALAIRVAGTDATTAAGALTQLGQALGSGTVHAEEFGSILDGVPTIAQAVAAGLKEAGGSVAKLKTLIVDGKVSSEAFFRAFEAGAPVLENKVAGATFTLGQRLTNLQTSLIDAAKRFNESSEASTAFGTEIDRVSAFVNSINFNALIGQISAVVAALNQGIQTVNGFANALGSLSGLDNVGKLLTGGSAQKSFLGGAITVTSTKTVTDRINDAFAGEIQKAGELTSDAIRNSVLGTGPATTQKTGRLAPVLATKPVSLAAFPVGGSGGGGGGKSKGGGGGGGGGGGESDYQREIEQIKERTAALQAETAAQATVNPLIDDYGYASERARTASDLLTAAQKSGLAVGKELKDVTQLLSGNFSNLSPAAQQQAQSMLELANGYAMASVEAEKLSDRQDDIRQRADEFKSLAKDAVGGFISDLRDGKSAAEALGNALDKVTEKLIDMALNAAFDGLFSGGGLGSLFSRSQSSIASAGGIGLYDKGGYTGAGGKYQAAGIVHKGEYVMDAEATKRIGVDTLRKLQGYANGGMVGTAPRLPTLSHRSASGDGNVEVKIINNNGSQVSQTQRKTSSGRTIDVVIDEVIADKMSTPGSRSRGAVQAQFGLKSGLAKR